MSTRTEQIDTPLYETFDVQHIEPSSTLTLALRSYTRMLSDGTMFTVRYWPHYEYQRPVLKKSSASMQLLPVDPHQS